MRQNKKYIAKELGAFLKAYRKKAQKGQEPNDRRYDPDFQRLLRRLKPDELDKLLFGDEDERLPTSESK